MKRYLFLIVFCIECFSQTGNNLKLPNENVYDFTMQESKGIKKEEIVERILVEIGKENLLERRKSNLFNCNYDKYNNSYCPINLVKAESYWDYTSNYDYKLQERKYGTEVYTNNKFRVQEWIRTGTVSAYTNIRSYDDGWKDITHFTIGNGAVINDGACYSPDGDRYYNCISPTIAYSYIDYRIYNGKLQERKYGTEVYTNNKFRVQEWIRTGTVSAYTNIRSYDDGWKDITQFTKGNGAVINDGACYSPDGDRYYNCISPTIAYSYIAYRVNIACPSSYDLTPNKDIDNGLCRRIVYKCPNNSEAVYVENEWRCSPYLCNGDMRCGYGSCENGTEASKEKYQDVAYNPLKQLYAKQCNSALCDYVENRDISYCERKSCPEGEDIISQDGRCYKIECPKGTYLSGTKCLKSDF